MHNLCNADIRLTYLKKPYSVTMGTFQMACLLGFNQASTLSIRELQEFSQLPEKELVKQVQSLLEAKLLLIRSCANGGTNEKSPNKPGEHSNNEEASSNKQQTNEELTETTQITLNMDYSNKRTKFKINAAIQKETPQVNKVFFYELET